jgi:histidyl-tRNA synthetase
VVVTVFDKARIADYQKMVTTLRHAGIRAELYLGSGKMGPQLKYADKRGSPCVVIQGGDEKAKGEVQIKDLIEGAKAAAAIASHQEWRESRPAQFAVAEAKLVEAVREVLARHDVRSGKVATPSWAGWTRASIVFARRFIAKWLRLPG